MTRRPIQIAILLGWASRGERASAWIDHLFYLSLICAGLLLTVSGCSRQDASIRPPATQQNSNRMVQNTQDMSSPSPPDVAAQLSVKGFSVKVVSVRRAKEWDDPRFKDMNFGPAGGPHLQSQKAGFEFAIIQVDVKRLEEKARFDLRELWIIDTAGKKYKSPVLFQDKLGESAAETREFVFSVPVKSELKRIQLATETFIELP